MAANTSSHLKDFVLFVQGSLDAMGTQSERIAFIISIIIIIITVIITIIIVIIILRRLG